MDRRRVFDQEIEQLKEKLLAMGIQVQGLIHRSIESLQKKDRALAEAVINDDEKVDQLELEVDEMCVQLIALRQPEASDLRFLMTGMRISNDLERIGDLAVDIAEQALDLMDEPLLKPLVDIPKMAKLAQDAVALVLDAFVNRDPAKAKEVWEKERESDKLRDAIHDELVEIMSQDSKTVKKAIPLLLISRHLERICDHTTNVAEDVTYMVEGKVIKHTPK